MANYISFRDVGAVMSAGSNLVTAGESLHRGVLWTKGALNTREAVVFTKRDGYSQGFWNDTYAAPIEGSGAPRNENLLSQSLAWAGSAETLGLNVVTATTTILWQDAIAAAELATATLE